MILWQDDENESFDTVTTYGSELKASKANVGSDSVAVPGSQQSHTQLVTNGVPETLELTVPVPMPMINNSGMNLPRQAKKNKRNRRQKVRFEILTLLEETCNLKLY